MMRETTNQNSAGTVPVPPALVEKARTGDQGAFAELYERTYPILFRVISSMVRDEDQVWDVLQDSYVRAFRGLDRLEKDEAFLPWLRRIAVNVAATKLAQRPPLTFTELFGEDGRAPELPDLDPETQPELALDRKETARMVRELLAALPEEQRLILGMRYYEELSIQEIAEALHLAPGTVKAQLHRGRKRLEAGLRALNRAEPSDRRSA